MPGTDIFLSDYFHNSFHIAAMETRPAAGFVYERFRRGDSAASSLCHDNWRHLSTAPSGRPDAAYGIQVSQSKIFRLSFGRIVPHFTSSHIAIHFSHRLGALLVASMIVWTFYRVRDEYRDYSLLRRPATLLFSLLWIQAAFRSHHGVESKGGTDHHSACRDWSTGTGDRPYC
jgi:hypothetical protein